jgi:hypothetical protein
MDNLSTVRNTDITSQIGALELGGYVEGYGDGVLETAFGGPPPNTGQTIICRTATVFPGACISDGALEIAVAGHQGPTQPMGVLRCASDDGALLSAADTAVSNPPTAFTGIGRRC